MSRTLDKRLNLPDGTAEAIPVERARWNRIKRRIHGLDEHPSTSALSAGAAASFELAANALIAAIVIPTGGNSGISPIVQPALLIGSGAGMLLGAAFFAFFLMQRRDRRKERSDILDEMQTEEEAWSG